MNRKRFFTFWLSCMMICSGLQAQTLIFVAGTGNDTLSGATWQTAKRTVGAAIASAGSNAVIRVKVGTYSGGFTVPTGVTVVGGYPSSLTGTDTSGRLFPGTNSNWNSSLCTCISGNQVYRVAVVNAGGRLEGCVVGYGFTDANGAGVLINGGTVQHCVLIYNVADNEQDLTAKGGGAYLQNNGQLINCVVAYNSANDGAGVAGTDGSLINNTITQNYIKTNCGTVTDYDGNVYATVVIGAQCWMKENLKTTHYANGTTVTGLYNPNGDAGNVSLYGKLYTWNATMGSSASSTANPSGVRGICPTGWHVPSNAEWTQLSNYVNSQAAYRCDDISGNIAKSMADKYYWNSSNGNCAVGTVPEKNNTTGFSARPAGYYLSSYNRFGDYAYFWSATESSSTDAYYRNLSYNNATVYSYGSSKSFGYSVRCLRD